MHNLKSSKQMRKWVNRINRTVFNDFDGSKICLNGVSNKWGLFLLPTKDIECQQVTHQILFITNQNHIFLFSYFSASHFLIFKIKNYEHFRSKRYCLTLWVLSWICIFSFLLFHNSNLVAPARIFSGRRNRGRQGEGLEGVAAWGLQTGGKV